MVARFEEEMEEERMSVSQLLFEPAVRSAIQVRRYQIDICACSHHPRHGLLLLEAYVQIAGASRHTTSLLEAVGGITALVLAKHEVFVDILAMLANEEARRL